MTTSGSEEMKDLPLHVGIPPFPPFSCASRVIGPHLLPLLPDRSPREVVSEMVNEKTNERKKGF
jgi:hypothetical protein